jgi:serine/arginine repetitive matrix protein 1
MSAALVTNVDKKLLRTTKFPPEFDRKVDMEKVNKPVIKKWVADEVARILNNDDDIVTELISNVLEESQFVRH